MHALHAFLLFVDDYLLVQQMSIPPLMAALISLKVQAVRLPICWRNADLHWEVNWIGWTFNFSNRMIKLQQNKRRNFLTHELGAHPRASKKHIEIFLALALWAAQIFPAMRAFLHYLYVDLYEAPGTSYSNGVLVDNYFLP